MSPSSTRSAREKIREYARAVGETNPLHLDLEAARAAGYADLVAPPMFAVVYSGPAVGPADLRPRDRAQLRDDGPRRPGVRVGSAGGRGRRGHHHRERQGHLRSGRSRLLRFRVGLHEPARRARSAAEPGRTSCEGCERDGRSCSTGVEIPELRVTPDKYLTVRYAGASGDFNPIHIDEEFARAVGLPGRILHGLWTMAQVARAQTEAAGGPERLKRLVGAVPWHGRARAGGRRHRRRARDLGRARAGRHRRRAGGQADHPQRRGRARGL